MWDAFISFKHSEAYIPFNIATITFTICLIESTPHKCDLTVEKSKHENLLEYKVNEVGDELVFYSTEENLQELINTIYY